MPEFITLTLGGPRSGKIIINPADIICVSDGLYPPLGHAPTDLRNVRLRDEGVVRVEESMDEIMMELGIDEEELADTSCIPNPALYPRSSIDEIKKSILEVIEKREG
jgi:hypothetical protein